MMIYKPFSTWMLGFALVLVCQCNARGGDAGANVAQGKTTYQSANPLPFLVVQPDHRGSVRGWVWADDDGVAKSVSQAVVRFVPSGSGRTSARATTSADGQYAINGLVPGLYDVFTAHRLGFSVVSVLVAPTGTSPDPSSEASSQEVANLNFRLISVGGERIKSLLMRYCGKECETNQDQDLRASFVAQQGGHQVRIKDGQIAGKLFRRSSQRGLFVKCSHVNVFVIDDGAIVGRAAADETGAFSMDMASAGHFGFIAIGDGGFCVDSIEVIDIDIDGDQLASTETADAQHSSGVPDQLAIVVPDSPRRVLDSMAGGDQGDRLVGAMLETEDTGLPFADSDGSYYLFPFTRSGADVDNVTYGESGASSGDGASSDSSSGIMRASFSSVSGGQDSINPATVLPFLPVVPEPEGVQLPPALSIAEP